MKSILLTGMALLLSACGAGGNAAANVDDIEAIPDANVWAVEMHVTGGFAGLQRSIYIGNNAKVIVKDARRKLYIERIMTKAMLDEVEALLPKEQTNSIKNSIKNSGKCRDCFHYNLVFHVHDRMGRIQANDMTLAQTRDKALIHKLMTIQDQLIKSYKK